MTLASIGIRLIAILAVVASLTSIVIGWILTRGAEGERRRLLVSMHISSGIVLSVSTALLAFWILTS